jgi:hypothetical protein
LPLGDQRKHLELAVGQDVFDATLDKIDPAWRDHLNA